MPKLSSKTVALLISPKGTEEPEFAQPKQALEEAGATVVVVSTEPGEAQTVNNDLDPGGTYSIDKVIGDVSASDFNALVIPGGTVGADTLRGDKDVVAFVRDFFEQKKPVAAICHAPWVLAEADVLKGRKVTSYASIQTDLKNAGATWVDEAVVTNHGLVTSRTPDDLPAFCKKVIEEVGEGKHDQQAMSV